MAQSNGYRRSSSELPWELRRRGLKDSLRHDQRVKEAIRKNLRELVSTGTVKQRGACQGAEPCESSAIANLTANDENYALAA